MTDRAVRIGANEAVFRHINEQIEDLNRAFAEMTETMDVICECGNLSCAERLLVPIPEYERVRSDSALFLVVPGHEKPDVEDVVEDHDHYFVLRKKPGLPEEIAEDTDPRRNG
jgi:hypothetical protein